MSAEERSKVKLVARLLLSRLKQLLVINSRQKYAARSQIKHTIEDVLEDGLPRAYDQTLYEQKCSALFEHVFECYPERHAGVYASTGWPPPHTRPITEIVFDESAHRNEPR